MNVGFFLPSKSSIPVYSIENGKVILPRRGVFTTGLAECF